MQILLTIISYLFVGGISSLTTFFTLKATMKKSNAEAQDMEEQAESKAIQNDKDRLAFYDNLINDMTNRLNKMLTRVTEAEKRNDELLIKNNALENKYIELENNYIELKAKYNELEAKYNELKKKRQ